jgi:hypothetical protein
MKTSPTFGVIKFAPDFVPSLNVQQDVVFGGVQPDRHFAGAGDFTDENANHLGGGSAERFGNGISLGQQRFFNPATKKHSHAPIVPQYSRRSNQLRQHFSQPRNSFADVFLARTAEADAHFVIRRGG